MGQCFCGALADVTVESRPTDLFEDEDIRALLKERVSSGETGKASAYDDDLRVRRHVGESSLCHGSGGGG